jgi:hypothetical protein
MPGYKVVKVQNPFRVPNCINEPNASTCLSSRRTSNGMTRHTRNKETKKQTEGKNYLTCSVLRVMKKIS